MHFLIKGLVFVCVFVCVISAFVFVLPLVNQNAGSFTNCCFTSDCATKCIFACVTQQTSAMRLSFAARWRRVRVGESTRCSCKLSSVYSSISKCWPAHPSLVFRKLSLPHSIHLHTCIALFIYALWTSLFIHILTMWQQLIPKAKIPRQQ